MNLLITGAGLIGVHAAQQAMAEGHRVVLLDVAPDEDYLHQILAEQREHLTVVRSDVRDWSALIDALQNHSIDALVHTAGMIGKTLDSQPYTGADINLTGTLNVLESARLAGVKRIVYVSTFGVYARDRITADRIEEQAATGRDRLYATTKLCAEQLITAWTRRYDLDTVILRPAAVYGPGHYRGGSGIGVAMRDLMADVMAHNTVTLTGHFSANEYLYCKDAAAAVLAACEAASPAQRIYNVGTGMVHTARQFAETLKALKPGLAVTVPSTHSASTMAPLNVDAAERELGFRAGFSLLDGLRDYQSTL